MRTVPRRKGLAMFAHFVLAQVPFSSILDSFLPSGGFEQTVMGILFLLAITAWMSVRYIPHNAVGVVEKLWSLSGSVPEGRILALGGEAGFQVELLRGGLHFGLWRFQYRLHKVALVTIRQGRIGDVCCCGGEVVPHSQAK